MDYFNDDLVPAGLGMALAQDINAMRNFTNLTEAEREEIMNQARDARSNDDMNSIVGHLAEGRVF